MKKILSLVAIICLISFVPSSAFAVGSGGFENASFSAKQLALGGAGTATADEPAAISYNPAGITELPGIQFQSNANFLSLFTWKKNNVTGDTRSSGTINFVPTAYLTVNPGKIFDDRVTLGVGTDSPFGLNSKYNSNDPAVHYTGWKSQLKMFTVKPVIAVKPFDWLSVGGGPMLYRIFNFGAIQGYPNNLVTAPFGVNTPDGQLRLKTNGNGWGWHMGVLARIKEKHRLGFYFRSPVVVDLHGTLKVENANFAGIGLQGLHNFETRARIKMSLPMNMTWAYAFQQSPKTHYEIDFGYTRWATHKRLYITTDPVASAADQAIINALRSADKDYRDSYSLHFGASHKLTKKLTLRGGSFFFWTPVPKTSYIPAVPDSNRLSLTIGAGYEITKNLTADLSYYNTFFFRRRINNSIGENAALLNSSVDGTYRSYLQAFTISVTLKWDNIFPRANQPGTEIMPSSIAMNPAIQ